MRDRIYQFDPGVYPRKIWIVIGWTEEDMKEEFDDNVPEDEHMELEGTLAITTRSVLKSTDDYGVRIWFRSLKDMTVFTMAHEAVHVADMIWDDLGLCQEETACNEHYAYFIGWVVKSMQKAKEDEIKAQEEL